MPEKNGSWRTYALSVAIMLCGALGSVVLAGVKDDVKQLQQHDSARIEQQAQTATQVEDMHETVQRIEKKVDLLIERGRR